MQPAMLPRTLRRLLTIFSWSFPVMWPLAIAAIWVFPAGKDMLENAATLSTVSVLILAVCDAAERNARRRAGFAQEREDMIIVALNRACDAVTQPQPALKVVKSPR